VISPISHHATAGQYALIGRIVLSPRIFFLRSTATGPGNSVLAQKVGKYCATTHGQFDSASHNGHAVLCTCWLTHRGSYLQDEHWIPLQLPQEPYFSRLTTEDGQVRVALK
jgi:hypothetical protein|tara:strand:- start:93 stop:425 length:333 start_codon:yes stop_codon:yes gene_type:complete